MPSFISPSRRAFLVGASAAALTPMIVFRANAQAGLRELSLTEVAPNPKGVVERAFLLTGDPLAGPIERIVAADGSPVPSPALPEGERRVLRILHINDMHNHLTEMHSKRGDTHRFSQIVKMVRAARASSADNEITLFVSAGDDHTGSVFDELMGWSPEEFVADAGYRAASAAGLDIAVLGNHEFDRGAEMLRLGIERDVTFPVLSANIHGSAHMERDRDYHAAAILEAKGLRIGVIGLTTSVDTRVGTESDPGLAVASPVTALENLMPAVSAVSDVVVILSHCGYGAGSHQSGRSAFARRIDDGDFVLAERAGPLSDKPIVLVGGHTHTVLNETGINPANVMNGVLITQANANGRHLGDIAMSIAAENGRRGWFTSVSLHPTKRRDDRLVPGDDGYEAAERDEDYDQQFEAEVIGPMIAALEDKMAEAIGNVVDPEGLLSRHRTISDRYIREAALANFMNDALVARSSSFANGTVDLALFNATGLAAGVDEGPLSFGEWFDVMPYADQVHVATVTGRDLKAMLDSNAKRILRPEEVESADLNGFVSRGFLHFSSGLRYAIELGGSAAEARAVKVEVLGQPLESQLDKTFSLAINSYIQLGAFGEAWNGAPISGGVAGNIASLDIRGWSYNHTGLVYRNEVIAHIRDLGTVTPENGIRLDGRLRIA
ncbi:multifunctional 2',3'-cyclic-nucleotide 2'-phosphodiesterase/5'-nucleotidase/3'-nucleotidase [Roseibium aquae]|uniref:Multifunctional 2',3'-cyclic-nucleotide 2'-phosphodiesterase/5'-nucleotidase/3'-nucleotidase n=1 Tax=Roseibium aquae TaxID=1323746 RepID=A0A916TI35_9HYPH|nr:5'-nucleotidase C-terminal domain-containing protein [Roseibium aquae]GGB44126.1 multifunctional 2',3'-cyclic-nucleotide 2'-phosphodiesterase/5'-nucleotidase/3'-nucleotidase [Roseibium aquae]